MSHKYHTITHVRKLLTRSFWSYNQGKKQRFLKKYYTSLSYIKMMYEILHHPLNNITLNNKIEH